VPPARKEKIENQAKVSLPNDFLEGLPESKRKIKARRLNIFRQSKEETKHERIKNLQEAYRKQLVAQDNHLKTLGHTSKNKMESLAKRSF